MDSLNFGRRVAALRRARGLTQEELAARIGLTDGGISHIEVGRRLPSIETLEALALALDAEAIVDLVERGQASGLAVLLSALEVGDLARLARIARALPRLKPRTAEVLTASFEGAAEDASE